jgi:uncharacterized protein (DUF1697 family)
MDEQNEQPEVIEQEEEQIEEQLEETLEEQSEEESDDIVLSKSEFKKLQRKAIAYDATKETKEVKTAKPTEKTDLSSYEVKLERLELRADGYSPDEIDAIQELGGAKALKNPVVQSAIKAMRAEKKSQDAKEPLNSKSPVFKKYTQQDLGKMSASEMEKILQE